MRRVWNALPPIPRLPPPRRIASWWRHNARHSLPPLPSLSGTTAWWRRHKRILPPLPHVPTPADIIESYRHRPPAEWRNQSALPSLPSRRRISAWFRARPRRRKIALRSGVAAAVVIAAAFAALPLARAVQAWQARRLTSQALALIEEQRWGEATTKLEGAFRIRNTETEVWRAYARLLSRAGWGESALEWWRKIAQQRDLSLEDHRDFATAAISAKELPLAAEQIDLLFAQKEGPNTRDLALAGQLATLRGYNEVALSYAEKILGDPRANYRALLSGAALVFLNSTPPSPSYSHATERLLKIARDKADPASVDALTVLAGRPVSVRPSDIPESESPSPEVSAAAISPTEIAGLLEGNPNSRPYHKMIALELRTRAEPDREDELVGRAIQIFGHGSDETLIALSAWLSSRNRFESILAILPPERAGLRRELFIQRVKALAALTRFAELKETLLSEQPIIGETFQHMYLAVVEAKLGESSAAANEWLRALGSADAPQELVSLADYAEKNGALDIAEGAYARLIAKQPGLRSAYASRLRLTEVRGDTAQAQNLAAEIVQLWPDDSAARLHEAYLRLLRGAPPAEVKEVERESESFSDHNPRSLGASMTLALARLKQDKPAAALAAVANSDSAKNAETPLVVRAAALAANGWKDQARAEAKKLTAVSLLPEERALIAPLLTGD